MTTLEAIPDPAPVRGDYHGRPTLILSNAAAWLEVLEAGGPRIVRLGLAGSTTNLLAETPDLGWDTPTGRYELLGGHRLWFAPDDPEAVAVPDSDGLRMDAVPGGLRLTGRIEPATGLIRSIEIHLDPSAAVVSISHELRNGGSEPIELAPWSITQLPLGGVVLMPQPRAVPPHRIHPNRNVVLWPYTSWADDRLTIRDGLLLVDARPGDDVKVGCFTALGWIAYVRDAIAFVRRFEPAIGQAHPDLECNVEAFSGSRYAELEVLGPLRMIEPGERSRLEERWELRTVRAGRDDLLGLCDELAAAAAAEPASAAGERAQRVA